MSEAAQAGQDLLQEDPGEEGLSQEQAPDVLALPLQNISHQGCCFTFPVVQLYDMIFFYSSRNGI